WDREAEGLCRLAIDYKLLLGRCLHRKVGRLLALEDAIDVARCATVVVKYIGVIRHEAAAGDKETIPVDRRQLVPGGERYDQIAMAQGRSARGRNQAAIYRACKNLDGVFDLIGVTHIDRDHLDPERRGDGLNRAKLGYLRGVSGIPKDGNPRHVWRDLLE